MFKLKMIEIEQTFVDCAFRNIVKKLAPLPNNVAWYFQVGYSTYHQCNILLVDGGIKDVLFSPRKLGKMNPFCKWVG